MRIGQRGAASSLRETSREHPAFLKCHGQELAQGPPGHHCPVCRRSWQAGDPNMPHGGICDRAACGGQQLQDGILAATPATVDCCPQGHALVPSTTTHTNFTCDRCDVEIPQGGDHGCRQCNYDVCTKCLKVTESTAALEWTCPVCTFDNIPAHTLCEMCDRPKGQQVQCSTAGCSRQPWNGQCGEACCKTCAGSNGRGHGPVCKRKASKAAKTQKGPPKTAERALHIL